MILLFIIIIKKRIKHYSYLLYVLIIEYCLYNFNITNEFIKLLSLYDSTNNISNSRPIK